MRAVRNARSGGNLLPSSTTCPYHYDVKAFASIKLQSLREHIERVGIAIFSRYPGVSRGDIPRWRTAS